MLKFVKATLAFTWFSIFVVNMKKYLFGILLIFVFLQPVASRAIVYFSAHNPLSNTEHHLLTQHHTSNTSTPMEALATEEDDEDEHANTDTKNNECDWIIQNHIEATQFNPAVSKVVSYSYSAPHTSKNQPLYILWSVFRI